MITISALEKGEIVRIVGGSNPLLAGKIEELFSEKEDILKVGVRSFFDPKSSLGCRVIPCLLEAQVYTVGDLITLTREQLQGHNVALRRSGLGKNCLDHIVAKLEEKGLKLRGD